MKITILAEREGFETPKHSYQTLSKISEMSITCERLIRSGK